VSSVRILGVKDSHVYMVIFLWPQQQEFGRSPLLALLQHSCLPKYLPLYLYWYTRPVRKKIINYLTQSSRGLAHLPTHHNQQCRSWSSYVGETGHGAEGGLVRWAKDTVVVGKLSDNIK